MKIGPLHTAQVHVGTFDALLAGTGFAAVHHVDETLLARAQTDGAGAVRQDARYAVDLLRHCDALVCTCSTLGPLIDEVGEPYILRIDRPAFDAALAFGPRVLMVICLDSTRAPSEALLSDCAHRTGQPLHAETLLIDGAWPHFEAGDFTSFYEVIADQIRAACAATSFDAIVLAQASMAGAAQLLTDLDIPVLSTPQMAVDAAIETAQTRA